MSNVPKILDTSTIRNGEKERGNGAGAWKRWGYVEIVGERGNGGESVGMVEKAWEWWRKRDNGGKIVGVVEKAWEWWRKRGCGGETVGVVEKAWEWWRKRGSGRESVGVGEKAWE